MEFCKYVLFCSHVFQSSNELVCSKLEALEENSLFYFTVEFISGN